MKHTNEPTRHVPWELDPERAPRKHTLGPGEDQLHVGSMVFYKAERYWVSICPPSWKVTYYVRICNKPFRDEEPQDAECFFIHADLLDLVANAPKHQYGKRAPTVKSVERAKRTKEGRLDVGDDIATLLRGLTLEQTFETAASYLDEDLLQLQTKYAHLDNGRKRMVLGNRMRAKFKKEGK